jgi:hypothetical protein
LAEVRLDIHALIEHPHHQDALIVMPIECEVGADDEFAKAGPIRPVFWPQFGMIAQ